MVKGDGEDEEGTANSPIAPLEEAEVDCEEVEEGNAGEEEACTKSRRKVGKRRYVWCRIQGCMSGLWCNCIYLGTTCVCYLRRC